ncbi:MAG: hypothetical protein JXA25_13140 [Anaerolineales bacterium]|nr:hypothetical protein [Anaerolineales bacterium]
MRKVKYWFMFFLVLLLTGCQEIRIVVEFPQDTVPVQTQPAEVEPKEGLPSTDAEQPDVLQSSTETIPAQTEQTDMAEGFDPEAYFFPQESLPQDVYFHVDNRKTLLVSYLENPGSLYGIAHVREYYAYNENLFVTQILIQLPLDGRPEMLRSGHFGQDFVPTTEERSLGDASVQLHYLAEKEISYRFYRNNIMVVVDVRGSHPFATEDNAYQLAKQIYDTLPEFFPFPEMIESPPLELQSSLRGRYFRDLMLVDCYPPFEQTNPLIETEMGYCFQADVTELILNLKVGIYDKRYDRLVYMKEFLTLPPLGEWRTGLFYPVWGYSWQHFHEGDYEALFWVDDQLVEVIEYTYLKEQAP